MTPQKINALKVAESQNGIEEKPRGSNAGPEVEMYLKSIGLGKGFAWCMAFVYWCVAEQCKATKGINPLLKTGGVLAQWNFCKDKKMILNSSDTILPGDIFIMQHSPTTGHTGFVLKVLSKNEIQTIEGNTNDDGSREGYKVCIRTRKINTIKGFIRT